MIHIPSTIGNMRRYKDEQEKATIRAAAQITTKAHQCAMAFAKAGAYEYEVEAVIEYIFAKSKGTFAYESIVAGGANAIVLHYIKNNQRLKDGDFLLIDAGCEYEMYASDITRTFPVNGTFSPLAKRYL